MRNETKSNLVGSQKTMTVQEVANVLGVSADTIKNCIRRIMPNRMQNGKATMLTELEVSAITSELKSNTQVTNQLTYEAGSQVANTTTRLEIIANYRKATEAIVALLDDENKALKSELATTAKERDNLQVQFDESKEWRTIKWMEKRTGEHFNWRELVRASNMLHKEVKKVFDVNYGEVNAYHIDAWVQSYGDAMADVIDDIHE